MRNVLATVAGLIAIIAAIPYIRDTIRRKTKPNLVTWSTWTVLNVITAGAALAAGATQTAIFATAVSLCTSLVVIAGLRDGLKKYTVFDIACQALAVLAIILWQATDAPELAIALTIAASFIGSLPTYRHAWKLPYEETWQFYLLDGFSGLVAVSAVAHLNFAGLGYPLYIFISDYTIMGTILFRLKTRRHLQIAALQK